MTNERKDLFEINMENEDQNVSDNLKGKEYEKTGEVDKAIQLYERVVSRKFDGPFPYDRLCVLYRKQGDYALEEAVLEKAISIFTEIAKSGYGNPLPKLEYYQKRLAKLHKKMKKW